MLSHKSLSAFISFTPLFLFVVVANPAGAQEAKHQNFHRPVWLPDGESIVFMSDRAKGDWELYSMRLDGTDLRRLTHHEGWDGYAAVSPNGTSIVFDRGDEEGDRLTWMDLKTGETRVLARSEGEHLGGGHWAQGADRVFFQWERHGGRDVYAISVKGGEPQRITDSPDDEFDFAISPDGKSLVVVMKRGDASVLEIVELADGRRTPLVRSIGAVYGPDWSPDGRFVAYNSDEDGDQEIYIVDRAGHGAVQITDNDVADHLPVWSPDGGRLIYTSERESGEVIMVVDADGRYRLQLGMPR